LEAGLRESLNEGLYPESLFLDVERRCHFAFHEKDPFIPQDPPEVFSQFLVKSLIVYGFPLHPSLVRLKKVNRDGDIGDIGSVRQAITGRAEHAAGGRFF
jgi:hypothetical protein